jgi:hypothetical protein
MGPAEMGTARCLVTVAAAGLLGCGGSVPSLPNQSTPPAAIATPTPTPRPSPTPGADFQVDPPPLGEEVTTNIDQAVTIDMCASNSPEPLQFAVAWGDPSSADKPPGPQCRWRHQYAAPARYRLLARVRFGDGTSATLPLTVFILRRGPVVIGPPGFNGTISVGQTLTIDLCDIVDPRATPESPLRFLVLWGESFAPDDPRYTPREFCRWTHEYAEAGKLYHLYYYTYLADGNSLWGTFPVLTVP